MTQAEFQKTRWGSGMKALYRGEIWLIVQVDFEEELIGLLGEGDSLLVENLEANASELTTWARCENVELVNYQVPQS
jgi:hypothetical protein